MAVKLPALTADPQEKIDWLQSEYGAGFHELMDDATDLVDVSARLIGARFTRFTGRKVVNPVGVNAGQDNNGDRRRRPGCRAHILAGYRPPRTSVSRWPWRP